MPGIIVGVDGSGDSQKALEWAVREAAVRNAALTVLTVEPVAASPWTGNPVTFQADQADREKIRVAAEEAVAKATSQLATQPGSVTVRAVSGFPAVELIEASKDADLLVVGSRGAGGFASLLLGSISNQVVHHAACPVVVVPHDR
jgi:nucleotide-binding universal stress UspA family protein